MRPLLPDTWRYDPAVSRRDLRLDLLRGLCLAKMIFNHLWKTPLHPYQLWLGYVTAAEGFFLLSGTVVGIVHGRRVHERGLGPTSRTVVQRALNLYLANLAFVFLFLALEATDLVPNEYFGYGRTFAWFHPFQLNQPYYLQVLPRYVAFLAATPIALWCLTRGRTAWLLAGSCGLWLANLVQGGRLLVPGLEPERHVDFPLLAWQLLFFVGMALGYHRRRVVEAWRRLPGTPTAALLLGLCLLFSLHQVGVVEVPALGGEGAQLLLEREALGPVRLVNLTAFAALAFLVTDRLWRPLARSVGPVLLPFGQSSLYLFLMHIPVVWLGRSTLPALTAASPHWSLLLLDAAVLALLWLAIRRRFLFDWVPS